MTTHAKHISDWDKVLPGQYFNLTGSTTNCSLLIFTFFKDLDGDASKAQMSSFLADAAKLGASVQGETTVTSFANDIVGFPDDPAGYNNILSSRLVPGSVYANSPEKVGPAYRQLLSQGIPSILGLLVAGGTLHSRNALWPISKLTHHPRRPSVRQCQHRFRGKPCMALGKDPCKHSSRYTVVRESNSTDSARLSPPKLGTIPCPPQVSRRCERILLRQPDLCSRDLLVANPVVATQTRQTCSSQTSKSHSSAATMHVLRRSRLHTTLRTYSSSQLGSAVNSGTQKGCVRSDGYYIINLLSINFLAHIPFAFT